jgi:hypothetical protein
MRTSQAITRLPSRHGDAEHREAEAIRPFPAKYLDRHVRLVALGVLAMTASRKGIRPILGNYGAW